MVDSSLDAPTANYGFDVKQVYVARRPMRKGGLRLEKTELITNIDQAPLPLIHCYGAGASGYKISWGVAGRVYHLVERISSTIGSD
jgi:D-amino-acid oxidase